MTATREYTLSCDATDLNDRRVCETEYAETSKYVHNLRRMARAAGWTRNSDANLDYCPRHANGYVVVPSEPRVDADVPGEKATQRALHRQSCAPCKLTIFPGDLITRGPKVVGWVHEGCYPT